MPLLKLTPYLRCTEAVLFALGQDGFPTSHQWQRWRMRRYRAKLSKYTKYIAHHLSRGNRYLAGEAYQEMANL